MFLDPNDSLGLYATRIYEPIETEFVKREVNAGDVVLDIGAHIGYYSLLFARLVGESGRVFAFEPDATNFTILRRNVAVNAYENVTLIRSAVSSRAGVARLYLSPLNTGDHRMYDPHDDRDSVDVTSVRLDDYFEDYKREIRLIKMDIQGAEWMAMGGMQALVRRIQNVRFMTEFWPRALTESGGDPGRYLAWFEQNGFQLYEVNRERRKLRVVSVGQLLDAYTPERNNSTNLFCVRSDAGSPIGL